MIGEKLQRHGTNNRGEDAGIVMQVHQVHALAIGEPGAKNAALLAVSILANSRPDLKKKLHQFRDSQTETVLATTLS